LAEALRARMREASDAMQFEVAARYRDQIQAIEKTIERQKVVAPDQVDRDFFGVYREGGGFGETGLPEAGLEEGGSLSVAVLVVRKGKIVASAPYHFSEVKTPAEEALGSLLTQFYSGERGAPKEVALPLEPENREALEQWLSEKRGERVSVIVPQRGDKRRLLDMAETNAKTIYDEHQRAAMASVDALEELQRALLLRKRPDRIEAFDISNISGRLAVGSMVVFEDGRPKKSDYRRYKVRTVEGADDYAMMREVLERRLARAVAGGPRLGEPGAREPRRSGPRPEGPRPEDTLPSLIIVDGGKGQLNVALSVLDDLQVIEQDVIGIAKEKILYRRKAEVATKEADKIYIPHRKDPIILRAGSPALRLAQRVRDEAHRFAITYHKSIRSKAHTRSALDEIRGIGPARRTLLLKRFGSVSKIADAPEEEVAAAARIPLELAREVKLFLSHKSDAAAGSSQ
jgi:excinuclease ABC subunit C